MKNLVVWNLGVVVALMVLVSGCALMNRVAPNQVDAEGKIIPGTHQVVQPVQDVAAAIPYGSFALNGFLLIWNFIEKTKSKKTAEGLRATVLAIKQASEDPDIRAAVDKLKIYLANSQKSAGVQDTVKAVIAKV